VLSRCSAEERHATFIIKEPVHVICSALSKERRRATPFAQERVDSALSEKRVGALAEEGVSALFLVDVVEQLGVVELADAAFGERLGLSGRCVELLSTGRVEFDVAAAAVDVDATCLTDGRHVTAWTHV